MYRPLGKKLVEPYTDWSVDRIEKMFGHAELSPTDPVVTGEFGSWQVTYHTGVYGVGRYGRIVMPFKYVSGWGAFQNSEPSADNYFSVECSNPAANLGLIIEHPQSAVFPLQHAATAVVRGVPLGPDEWIRFSLGDRSQGSRGWRAQHFSEDAHAWSVWVDALMSRHYVQVPGVAPLRVVAGPAEKVILTVPATVTPNEPAWLAVRLIDRFGNTATQFRGTVRFEPISEVAGLPKTVKLGEAEQGSARLEGLSFLKPGVFRLRGEVVGSSMKATSNPLLCNISMHRRLYFGDLQSQSNETAGTNTAESLFRFARNVSCIDFMAHTANDWELQQGDYEKIRDLARKYDEPHRFVAIAAYEWSAPTPAGGDHCVLYLNDGEPIHRCGHFKVFDGSDTNMDRYPLTELIDTFRGREDVFATPHIGGRMATLDIFDPSLMPYIEICSTHGRFEWFARDAISRGLNVGFVGSTDDHTGRPGAGYSAFADARRGGLAAVYAGELTRPSIWEGIRRRQVYATTGDRIILDVHVNGVPMGQETRTGEAPAVSVEIHGTGPIRSAEILRDLEVVYRHDLGNGSKLADNLIRIEWSDPQSSAGRPVRWDGELAISSGRIVSVRRFGYHSPLEPITEITDQKVGWISTIDLGSVTFTGQNRGNVDGLLIEFDSAESAVLDFRSEPVSFRESVADLLSGDRTYRGAGAVGNLTIGPVPAAPGPLDVSFEFVDRSPLDGRHAYWLRVIEEDNEMAWSTPIWVDRS